jgi:RimJ/RimL family protein N-acetyltransferase
VTTWHDVDLTCLTLETERLMLRPLHGDDVSAMVRMLSEQRMHQHLSLPNPYTTEAGVQFTTVIAPTDAEKARAVHLGVVSSGQLVGVAGLHHLSEDAGAPEIGYWIGGEFSDQGYATEATRALTDFAFDRGVRRIQIRADIENIASCAVALRAGYRFEGVRRRDVALAQRFADSALFARLRGDDGCAVDSSWPRLDSLTDGVVTLRPVRPGDAALLHAEDHNPESRHWSLFPAKSEESTADTARGAALDWLVGRQASLVICEAEMPTAAGTITARKMGPPGVVGVGYGVLPGFRGRGYAARALQAVAGWLFTATDTHRIELGCKVDNVASARVAERAGFLPEGRFTSRLANRDARGILVGYSDEYCYARIRP